MIKVTAGWIAEQLGATLVPADAGETLIEAVSTDSRSMKPGALFVALGGENFDGHGFAHQAMTRGAVALLVDRQLPLDVCQIIVTDTTAALGTLGAAVKAQLQHRSVAITGSVGKTTVKEMIAAILSRLGKVLATQGNFNNHIGVPLTLLRLEVEHQFAVFELGADRPGEIAYTTALVQPDVALINNVAAAHLDGFIDLQGVATAKGEIFSHSPETAMAVVNRDSDFADQWLSQLGRRAVTTFALNPGEGIDVWAEAVSLDPDACARFTLCHHHAAQAVALTCPGRHNIANALAAAAVCIALGATLTDIALGLAAMKAVAGRVNLITLGDGLTLIDDSYNANVESAKAAIDLLGERHGEKILVLGDMAELGEDAQRYHRQVGDYAHSRKIDTLLTLGELSRQTAAAFSAKAGTKAGTKAGKKDSAQSQHFSSRERLIQALIQMLAAGKSVATDNKQQIKQQMVTILVKGSRSAKMELVVQALVKHYQMPREKAGQEGGAC